MTAQCRGRVYLLRGNTPDALLTNPIPPGAIYAGLTNSDVWPSPDQGAIGRRLPFTLEGINRTLLALGRPVHCTRSWHVSRRA